MSLIFKETYFIMTANEKGLGRAKKAMFCSLGPTLSVTLSAKLAVEYEEKLEVSSDLNQSIIRSQLKAHCDLVCAS